MKAKRRALPQNREMLSREMPKRNRLNLKAVSLFSQRFASTMRPAIWRPNFAGSWIGEPSFKSAWL